MRRRRAFEIVAALSGGTMGRTPDYLNVTFACFAGRADVWARRGNEQGAANLVAYQAFMRDHDLSTTHALMNPQVDRARPRPIRRWARWRCTRPPTPTNGIVVRGARMLATLAPFADELLVYPGSDIRPQDGRYALAFAIPIATPGLRFICRESYARARDPYRLSAVVALRRDGRGGDLRRRRDPARAGVLGRRHGRLLRGDHRHRLARAHHAPGVHAAPARS